MGYMEIYKSWLADDYFDSDTKKELESLSCNEKEIEDRFYKMLEFGTGGLRGVIGAGTNRMNIYTVRMATQGLSNYILKQNVDLSKMGVAIAYDSRRMSPEFAREAALTLNGNGIKTYLFESLRPTPVLSFTVRRLGCIAGIVITASHNPPEYNGYKAYWSDGGQIPYPRDEEIIDEVKAVSSFHEIKLADEQTAREKGLFNVVGKEIDDAYNASVKAQLINSELVKNIGDRFTIVYTPLHGTGNIPVRRVLKEIGFNNVHVVPQQELPDADFSTVSYPNPEDAKAFTLAMELADKVSADLVVGTDPDADRVGAIVKNSAGEYVILTGNMTGILITEYILSQKKANGSLPENAAIISTIVSTDMTKEIAKAYGAAYFDVLTGFKYIGEKIKEFELDGSYQFLFGFEESYGCLAGTYARDKDAVVASMLLCEIAAYYKSRGMTLYEGLEEIYKKYGYYMESIESISHKGVEGLKKIKDMMGSLRENPPKEINGIPVVEIRDYKTGIISNIKSGENSKTNFPASDVLYFILEDGSWFCVRPSGTEPKIKIYFGVKSDSRESAAAKLKDISLSVMEVVNKI